MNDNENTIMFCDNKFVKRARLIIKVQRLINKKTEGQKHEII